MSDNLTALLASFQPQDERNALSTKRVKLGMFTYDIVSVYEVAWIPDISGSSSAVNPKWLDDSSQLVPVIWMDAAKRLFAHDAFASGSGNDGLVMVTIGELDDTRKTALLLGLGKKSDVIDAEFDAKRRKFVIQEIDRVVNAVRNLRESRKERIKALVETLASLDPTSADYASTREHLFDKLIT